MTEPETCTLAGRIRSDLAYRARPGEEIPEGCVKLHDYVEDAPMIAGDAETRRQLHVATDAALTLLQVPSDYAPKQLPMDAPRLAHMSGRLLQFAGQERTYGEQYGDRRRKALRADEIARVVLLVEMLAQNVSGRPLERESWSDVSGIILDIEWGLQGRERVAVLEKLLQDLEAKQLT